MRTLLATAALCLTWWSAEASAQPWREAYDAGDYAKAAAILQPMIVESVSETGASPDARATEVLAEMYAKGLGIDRDAAMSCALFNHAERAARTGSIGGDRADLVRHTDDTARISKRREEHCGALSAPERIDAIQLLGCPTAHFPKHTFQLSVTDTVEVDRQGVRLRYDNFEQSDELTLFACALQVAHVRYSRVDPPAGSSGTARHFVELFTWSAVSRDKPQIALIWQVREIIGREIKPQALEFVEHAPRQWPLPAWSPSSTDVQLTMDGAGNVRWQFTSSGTPHGMFEHEPRPRASSARIEPRR